MISFSRKASHMSKLSRCLQQKTLIKDKNLKYYLQKLKICADEVHMFRKYFNNVQLWCLIQHKLFLKYFHWWEWQMLAGEHQWIMFENIAALKILCKLIQYFQDQLRHGLEINRIINWFFFVFEWSWIHKSNFSITY